MVQMQRKKGSKNKPRKIPLFLSEDEVYRMFTRAKEYNQRDWKILMILYYFGLRNTEMTSLKKEDVNLSDMTLLVRGSNLETGEKGAKGQKDRLLPIGEFNPFRDRDKNSIAHYLAMWKSGEDGHVIEGDTAGGGISDRTVRRVVKRYAVWCKVRRAEEVHPHTMRHSFATHLRNMDVAIDIIQSLLGHSRIDTTMIYTHTGISNVRKALKKAAESVTFRQDFPERIAKISEMPEGPQKEDARFKLLADGIRIALG